MILELPLRSITTGWLPVRLAMRVVSTFGSTGRGGVGGFLGGGHRRGGLPLAPEHHPVGEALVLMGDGAELVVDHIAGQRVGLVGPGLRRQQLLAFRTVLGVALAEQGGARGAFGLEFGGTRLAGQGRAQRVVRRQRQRGLGHHPELVRRHLGEAQRAAGGLAGAQGGDPDQGDGGEQAAGGHRAFLILRAPVQGRVLAYPNPWRHCGHGTRRTGPGTRSPAAARRRRR